jgi:hypothetical protein
MSPVVALLIIGVATAVAVAAMLLARRRAPEGSVFADGDRAAGGFEVLARGYAVLLGQRVILTLGSVPFVSTVVWVATFPVTVTI